jgi:hypothetical protein
MKWPADDLTDSLRLDAARNEKPQPDDQQVDRNQDHLAENNDASWP